MIYCAKCDSTKPVKEFYLRPDGEPRKPCRACQKLLRQSYYQRHRERLLIQTADWQRRNPGKVVLIKRRYNKRHLKMRMARNLAWADAHPEQMKAIRDAWRKKNPTYSRDWAQRNKDKINSYSNNRRARYVGRYTAEDIRKIFARQQGRCANPSCLASIAGAFDVDHIEPIIKGGTNWPINLQLLCRKCNREKDAKDPYVWAQEVGRLFV